MTKKYKSDAMAAIHETVAALHKIGVIDKTTMRDFDKTCLTPIRPMSANKIKKIRLQAHVSQEVFAHYLNVSTSIVSQWERGEKHPSGPSLKLLHVVEKNGLEIIA